MPKTKTKPQVLLLNGQKEAVVAASTVSAAAKKLLKLYRDAGAKVDVIVSHDQTKVIINFGFASHHYTVKEGE